MTADQFIWWLRGYLSASWAESGPLPKADVQIVRDALDRVGPVQSPAPAPTPSIFDKAKLGHCYRCGTPLSNGSQHFCNGTLTL